jgi:ATP-dependent Clp protease ATP-binding subunit ClpA
MMERFTDNARATIRAAFRQQTHVSEGDILIILGERPRNVALRLLTEAGFRMDKLEGGHFEFSRKVLITSAIVEAKGRKSRYVGTQHILLALARLPDSGIAKQGLTPKRLEALLSIIEAEERQANPSSISLWGLAFRLAWQKLRGCN